MPKNKNSLLSLAKQINIYAAKLGLPSESDESNRVKMGHILYEVQQRFGRHTTGAFRKWCFDNVHKADGKAFSHVTICNYIKYAKNPSLMPKERERQRRYSQARTKAIKFLNGDSPVNGTNHAEQVNRLVYAWDHASDEARNQFMTMVKLKRTA